MGSILQQQTDDVYENRDNLIELERRLAEWKYSNLPSGNYFEVIDTAYAAGTNIVKEFCVPKDKTIEFVSQASVAGDGTGGSYKLQLRKLFDGGSTEVVAEAQTEPGSN